LKNGRRSTDPGRPADAEGVAAVAESAARHIIVHAAPINIDAARQHAVQLDLVTGNASSRK
jgi:hypothetical protein